MCTCECVFASDAQRELPSKLCIIEIMRALILLVKYFSVFSLIFGKFQKGAHAHMSLSMDECHYSFFMSISFVFPLPLSAKIRNHKRFQRFFFFFNCFRCAKYIANYRSTHLTLCCVAFTEFMSSQRRTRLKARDT